jgi:hypothetical protein
MPTVTITHQFDSCEESHEIERFLSSRKALEILEDIDLSLRSKLKHGEDEWLKTGAFEYLEEIRSKISYSGVLDV